MTSTDVRNLFAGLLDLQPPQNSLGGTKYAAAIANSTEIKRIITMTHRVNHA